MNKFHVSDVDVKLLQIFQAVFEEGSVTAASERLDLGQSLVSHALDRLRSAFHDPLFVRSGRSIAPTDRAQELAPDISRIIEQLHELAEPSLLNKKLLSTIFTLSANDFERRLIGSNLLADMLEEAPNASLRLINTEAPVIETLRSRQCDVVVAPSTLPDLHDFYSEPLFEDTFMCFFDRSRLSEKKVHSSYLTLHHAVVNFTGNRLSAIDQALRDMNTSRSIRLIAPSFESLSELILNTDLVATLPSRLAESVFTGFGQVVFPFPSPTLRFHMIWHKTTHHSVKYRWFRSLIRSSFE